MTRKILRMLTIIYLISIGYNAIPDNMEPVTDFEADRYLGTWYEIASLNHDFQRNFSNVNATHTRAENGDILVLNRGYNAKRGIDMSQQATATNKQIVNKFIEPCPKTPNCVSSIDTSRGHFIQPLEFSGSAKDALYKLLQILNQFKGARVVTFEDNFIEAEFISSVFRFVDDVQFYLDDRKKIIHVKSASRVGFSDLGVNRRRIEKIRNQLENYDVRT